MPNPIRRTALAVVLLMFLAAFLAEVLGGATPLPVFFSPGILLSYAVVLYGIPILVIREVFTRTGMGLLGLFCLGAIYGLYNEGLLSETLYFPLDHQVPSFSSYGLVEHLRLPWMLYILPWHGLLSVVTPVLFVDRLVPDRAGRPWLPKAVTWALGILVAAFGVLRFLLAGADRTQNGDRLVLHLAVVVLAAVALGALAVVTRRVIPVRPDAGPAGIPWRAFGAGVALYAALVLGELTLAEAHVPWPLFLAYAMATLTVAVLLLRRRRPTRKAAVVFVLGSGMGGAGVGIVAGSLTGTIPWVMAGVLCAAFFGTALVRLRRRD